MKRILNSKFSMPDIKHLRMNAASFSAAAAALLFLLTGCPYHYTPSTAIMPQHIRKIGLRPIKNNTTFFGLEDKLAVRLQEEFTRGGQYPLVGEELADGVLIAEIDRYLNEPVSYDENLIVQERKMWILVNIYFWDKVQNMIIWKETNLSQTHRYLVESRPGGMTEEQARGVVWDKLSRDIYKRTVEGFGSVTGELQNRVPQGTAGRKAVK